MKKILILIAVLFISLNACSKENSRVLIVTTKGNITVELFDNKAPVTVKNFLQYVQDGFYDGTIFHRVIPNFMVQGGGFTPDMEKRETRAPIKNEAKNGLSNKRGTLAMARTSAINSATAQFFINVADNKFLDHGARDFGYCVFGRVIDGMNVVDQIRVTPTQTIGFQQNVPVEEIIITKISILPKKKK